MLASACASSEVSVSKLYSEVLGFWSHTPLIRIDYVEDKTLTLRDSKNKVGGAVGLECLFREFKREQDQSMLVQVDAPESRILTLEEPRKTSFERHVHVSWDAQDLLSR